MKSKRIKSLLSKASSHVFMAKPIVFFIIFLHPIYLVRFLETSQIGVWVFKFLSAAVVVAGTSGIGWFIKEISAHVIKKKLADPTIWFKLPLAIVSGIIIGKFLIPLIFA